MVRYPSIRKTWKRLVQCQVNIVSLNDGALGESSMANTDQSNAFYDNMSIYGHDHLRLLSKQSCTVIAIMYVLIHYKCLYNVLK